MKTLHLITCCIALVASCIFTSCTTPAATTATDYAPRTLHNHTVILSFSNASITEEEYDDTTDSDITTVSKQRTPKTDEFGPANCFTLKFPLHEDKEDGTLLVRYQKTGTNTGKISTTIINSELLNQFKAEILPILYVADQDYLDHLMEKRSYTAASGYMTPSYTLRFTSPDSAIAECVYGDEFSRCIIRNISVTFISNLP